MIEDCPYCQKLKGLLSNDNIPFEEIDINKDENKEEYAEVFAASESDMVPIVRIENELLVPEKSFRTIEEAAKISKKLYNQYYLE